MNLLKLCDATEKALEIKKLKLNDLNLTDKERTAVKNTVEYFQQILEILLHQLDVGNDINRH